MLRGIPAAPVALGGELGIGAARICGTRVAIAPCSGAAGAIAARGGDTPAGASETEDRVAHPPSAIASRPNAARDILSGRLHINPRALLGCPGVIASGPMSP